MEHEKDWSIRMTAGIGKRIAAHRERQKLTVQAVADRCAGLGLPLGRVTITKLEGGKRQAITPAELTVLAAALEAAPIDLLYPIGHEDGIEVLPGIRIDPDHAVRWFGGELKLDVETGVITLREPQSGEESDTRLLQQHDALSARLDALQAESAESAAAAAEDPENQNKRETAHYRRKMLEELRDFIREPLLRIRTEMRERDMILPEIPPGIDDVARESYDRSASKPGQQASRPGEDGT